MSGCVRVPVCDVEWRFTMWRSLWLGALGKQGKMRIRNRLVIFSPFPKFTGHAGIATLGKHCVLVKKVSEIDEGKEPTE